MEERELRELCGIGVSEDGGEVVCNVRGDVWNYVDGCETIGMDVVIGLEEALESVDGVNSLR